eukprot:scaffold36471_cov199-Amphora_coffeaeformis.AAC.2
MSSVPPSKSIVERHVPSATMPPLDTGWALAAIQSSNVSNVQTSNGQASTVETRPSSSASTSTTSTTMRVVQCQGNASPRGSRSRRRRRRRRGARAAEEDDNENDRLLDILYYIKEGRKEGRNVEITYGRTSSSSSGIVGRKELPYQDRRGNLI